MTTPASKLGGSEWIAQIQAQAKAGTVPNPDSIKSKLASHFQSGSSAIGDNKVPLTKRAAQSWEKSFAQNWSKLNGEGKANVAIWGAGALFSAFNAVGAGRNSFSRDADSNVQTQWSNVGIALFSAVLTFGCAYAGVRALHSAGR